MDKVISNKMLIEALELYENKRLSEYEEKDFIPSEKFEKKMRKLIKSQTNYYYKATRTRARKVSAILVAAVVLLASAMSVTAIRETILGFFVSHENEVDVIEYNNEASASYPETIEKAYGLSYLPKGCELEDKTSGKESCEEYYVLENGNYIDFQQFTKGEYSSASDGEFTAPKKLSCNGQDYIIRTSDENMIMLVWEKYGYVFELIGFEDKDEMLKIAESVKETGEVEG